MSRSQNRSSLGTRYFWPWEADESERDEENRVDRERLTEFFTTAQNNFLNGPPRKWVAVSLRSILPTVLYGLQSYLGSNLVIGLICNAAPSSRHYSQPCSTGTNVFHTGGYQRNVFGSSYSDWFTILLRPPWLASKGRHQHVFPRRPQLFFFKLWLAHWTVYLCCDWPAKAKCGTCFPSLGRGCMHDLSSPDWIAELSASFVIGQ